jgi:hypothetical protein
MNFAKSKNKNRVLTPFWGNRVLTPFWGNRVLTLVLEIVVLILFE